VRLGAYGDPAAVPSRVWDKILSVAGGWTGYTHQWRGCDPRLMRYVMASCETAEDVATARRAGYRTFRVLLPGEPLLHGEFACPASAEAGKRRTCETCGACDGAKQGSNASPAIIVHGWKGKVRHYHDVVEQLPADRNTLFRLALPLV
jgi:hypothetical protein